MGLKMKYLVVSVILLAALFITSCSNFEQDSPVAPELSKAGVETLMDGSTYEYLQCFNPVEVVNFGADKIGPVTQDRIYIECNPKSFPTNALQFFAILEYNSITTFNNSEMVFLGKINKNEFILDGFSPINLKDVRIYALCYSTSLPPDDYPINTEFTGMLVNNWECAGKGITVITNDWKAELNDTFAELKLKTGNLLVYLGVPNGQEIYIPKFGDRGLTGVKLFGLFLD